MGTLFSSIDIASSGLFAAQVALDVTGHNIANVNKEGFSRQRVELASRLPITRPYGQIPRGVAIQRIARLRDVQLDRAFRQQAPGLGAAELRARYFSRLEATFLEPTENGFSNRISSFFNALNDFANNVELIPARQAVLSEAQALASGFRETAQRLYAIRTNLNEEVRSIVGEINSIAERIAALNTRIRPLEAGTREASDLRDDRDLLLDQLARLVDISVTERASGEVEVIVSGQQLVSGNTFRELEAFRNSALDPERADLVQVQFVDDGTLLQPRAGELRAALDMRDIVIPQFDAELDELAATLMLEFNRIHTQGRGLVAMSGTVIAGNAVSDPTVPLNSADLPFPVSAGSFDVIVYDAAGNPTTTTINVTGATTLNSLAADLNAVGNLSAAVNNNRLEITAAPGFSFAFANDDTDTMAALGVNVLFTGRDARDMDVSAALLADPALLSSGFDPDISAAGDNSAALALAAVQNSLIFDSGSATAQQFYESFITQLGVDARSNLDRLGIEQAFVADFNLRRQEVHGVNLDEEVTNLILFQRAFEASARVLSVADSLLDTLINGTR